MQNDLEAKTRRALNQWGARRILGALANVPGADDPACIVKAQGFLDRFGPLRPYVKDPVTDVIEHARRFRPAWNAKTESDYQLINALLDDIFTAGDPFYGERPVMAADFSSGKWQPQPRTLLDHLALELMRSRRMLHRCERPECRRYFVKEFSRDRYCSNLCSEEMRSRGQKEWAQRHREESNKRRRKRQANKGRTR